MPTVPNLVEFSNRVSGRLYTPGNPGYSGGLSLATDPLREIYNFDQPTEIVSPETFGRFEARYVQLRDTDVPNQKKVFEMATQAYKWDGDLYVDFHNMRMQAIQVNDKAQEYDTLAAAAMTTLGHDMNVNNHRLNNLNRQVNASFQQFQQMSGQRTAV